MSGDSPNAFTNENVFEFKEGRSSPAPTTSKDHNQQQNPVVTASVLVEPQQKDQNSKDEDKPDFSSPTLNPGEADGGRRNSIDDKTLELNDPKYEGPGKGKKKEEENLLNGDKLPSTNMYAEKIEDDDDSCVVNFIYYTMECCKCTIL